MKVGIAVLAVAVPLLTIAPTAEAAEAEQCLQHTMATVPGLSSQFPSAVAPGGRFVAGDGVRADGSRSVVLWDNGVPAELGITGETAAVGDDGQLVIQTYDGDAADNRRYRNGQLEKLPVPAGFVNARARHLSSNQSIAGSVSDADHWNTRGVVWDSANEPRVLPIPAGFNEVTINDIDDDGTVVGSVLDWDIPNAGLRAQRAAYWSPDGTITLLPASSPTAFTEATAIRNGIAVGTDGANTVRWDLTTGSTMTLPTTSGPESLNANGTVLLRSGAVYKPGEGERPLEMKDPGGASGINMVGLTDADQVYGADGFTGEPVRWDCD